MNPTSIDTDPILIRDLSSFTPFRRTLMYYFHPLVLLGLLMAMSTAENTGWTADFSHNSDAIYQDSTGDVSYVRMQPPAARTEQPPTTLTATQAWIPGHWAWQNGVFIWRPGLVAEKPSSNTRWEPGTWVPVVTRHHGWRYRPGHWIAD